MWAPDIGFRVRYRDDLERKLSGGGRCLGWGVGLRRQSPAGGTLPTLEPRALDGKPPSSDPRASAPRRTGRRRRQGQSSCQVSMRSADGTSGGQTGGRKEAATRSGKTTYIIKPDPAARLVDGGRLGAAGQRGPPSRGLLAGLVSPHPRPGPGRGFDEVFARWLLLLAAAVPRSPTLIFSCAVLAASVRASWQLR